jgi:chaperonin cofactor prefoldin
MENRLFKKVAALFTPNIDLNKLGLTDEALSSIGKQGYDSFISEISNIILEYYKKDPNFKKTVDDDINKKTDKTVRDLYKVLKTLPEKIENPETKQKLTASPSGVAIKIFKTIESLIKKGTQTQQAEQLKTQQKPIQKTGDLTSDELTAFGISAGNINTLGTDEDFYKAFINFEESPLAASLSINEKDAIKTRFKEMYEKAKGLQKTEISNYEANLFGYSGLNDIQPILNDPSGNKKDIFYSHINNLLSSKKKYLLVLGNDIKKDLIKRLYETLKNKYTRPDEMPPWLQEDLKNLDRMIDHWIKKPLTLEFLKNEKPQTEISPEEREEIKKKQEKAFKEKQDDPGRVVGFAVEVLADLSALLHVIESDELKKVFNSAIETISTVLPTKEDIQNRISNIQDMVNDMDITKEDIPVIFKTEEFYLKPDIQEKLSELKKNSESLSKEITTAETDEQKKAIAKKLTQINKRMQQLLKLQGMNLTGLKETSEVYLTYLRDKNKAISDTKSKMVKEINILNKVHERIDRLRKKIIEGKDALFNKSYFKMKWSAPGSTETMMQKMAAEETTKEVKNTSTSGLNKYDKIYKDFQDGAGAIETIKGEVRDDLKEFLFKLMSFLEINIKDPLKSKSLQNVPESEKGTLLHHLNSFKWILDKYGVNQDFTGNPLAGKDSSVDEMSKKLKSDFEKLKRKLDVTKHINEAQTLIEELTKLDKFIVAPNKKEAGSEVSYVTRLMQAAESIKELFKTGSDEDEEGWKTSPETVKKETLSGVETKIHKILSDVIGGKNNIPFYDLILGRKKETKTGPRKLPNFFKDDTSGFVKTFIENLSKENVNKAIEDPKFDVSKHINEAIEKTLNTRGGLGDYLANDLRHGFETKYDLKKLYKEMQEIDEDIRGKRDADNNLEIDPKTNKPTKLGVTEAITDLNKEVLEPIHKLIDFISNPLEKLTGKVQEERGKLTQRLEQAQKRKDNIKKFLQWAKDTKDEQGVNLLEKVMYGFKGKIDVELFNKYKEFVEKNRKVYNAIKSNKTDSLTDPEKKEFLKGYQQVFETYYPELPDFKTIIDDVKTITKQEDATRLSPIEEEFISKFNELTGRSFKTMPSPKDIQDQLKAAIAKPEDIVSEQASREKGLSAIKDMPEGLKKDIKKAPKDFWEEKWYKNLLKTRNLLPAKWFEQFLGHSVKEIYNQKEAKKRAAEIKKNISNLLARATAEANKLSVLSPKRTMEQLDGQKNRLQAILDGRIQKPLKEFPMLIDFSAKVITPLKNIESSQAEIEEYVVARYLLIREMNEVRDYYDNPFIEGEEKLEKNEAIKVREEKVKSLKDERDTVVGELSALLKQYDTKIQEVWSTVNANIAKIIPNINDFIKAAETFLEKIKGMDPQETSSTVGIGKSDSEGPDNAPKSRQIYEKTKYHQTQDQPTAEPVGLLPPEKQEKEFITVKKNIEQVQHYLTQIKEIKENLEEDVKKQLKDIGSKEKDLQTKLAAVGDSHGDAPVSEYDYALETRPSREDTEEEKEQGKGFVKGKPELYTELQKTIKYFNDFARGLDEGKEKTLKDLNRYSGYFNKLVNEKNLEADVDRLRKETIPGLKKLLKEKISLKGSNDPEVNNAKDIIISLEDAAEKLEDLIQEYFSRLNKIKTDYAKLLKRAVDIRTKIGDAEEFLEPSKEGITVAGFTDKEKDIMKKMFYVQLYKMLDIMWSRSQLQAVPVVGERDLPNYDKVWEAFRNLTGIKTNRKILGILSAIRADVRMDRDEITGIRKKSQALKLQRDELAKRYKALGEDPNKKEPILDLDKLIRAVEDKEGYVKEMFKRMKQTVDLAYLSKIKQSVLEEVEKMSAKAEGETEKTPGMYAPRELQTVVKNKDKKDIGVVVTDFQKTVDEDDKKLEGDGKTKLQSSIDEILAQAASLRDQISLNLDSLEKNKTLKEASYRGNILYNQKHLYGSIMKDKMREMLREKIGVL